MGDQQRLSYPPLNGCLILHVCTSSKHTATTNAAKSRDEDKSKHRRYQE